MVPDAGHTMHRENTAFYNKTVMAFLTRRQVADRGLRALAFSAVIGRVWLERLQMNYPATPLVQSIRRSFSRVLEACQGGCQCWVLPPSGSRWRATSATC